MDAKWCCWLNDDYVPGARPAEIPDAEITDIVWEGGSTPAGVSIVHMKDEYNNEAPYDFKNLIGWANMVRRFVEGDDPGEESNYAHFWVPDGDDSQRCYTFDNGSGVDGSLTGKSKNCVIEGDKYNHNFMVMGNDNTIKTGCSYCSVSGKFNVVGTNCEQVIVSDKSESNAVGNGCFGVTLAGMCISNTIGDGTGMQYLNPPF